ncbi:TATA box-binding protein-associated factor, RNA polymerase I, subunit C [Bagarius yarrelli]|uniref:TATA box-binding protein-associated factor, RNA polymerase I, subunit C n=1 Tax=Bagarius yarrelli TaxID=175774 RepID=A0A556TU96_BAGYA|nr:TATA box-binding protein-associated factor, RNA polymerase I, subunit C [Bagarius yarrelli]
MDHTFPHQLFPYFSVKGPPNLHSKHDYGGCGSYEHLVETTRASVVKTGVTENTPFQFQPQHKVDGEVWLPTEPIVTPLLPPAEDIKSFWGQPVSPADLPEHGVASLRRMKNFIHDLNSEKCEMVGLERVNRYHQLLGDVISDIPSSLLADLLHEELIHQEELDYFQPATTGGVLAYVQDLECDNNGILIYPSGEAFDSINFHPVKLKLSDDKPLGVKAADVPLVYNLDGTVRQVSVAQVDDEAYLGLRSDHFCAAWVIKPGSRPRPLAVVQLKQRATSLNVSPHVSGEFVLASESGSAYLWVMGKGLQKIRDEKTNLYFNAESPWRWCDFTAHPRVMVYADRTGAELTDIRFSAYLLDERMPCVPVLKWEHMMESPPCFAHVVPALDENSTSKVLLGAQTAQETMLLQYSGGREWPCQADGPIQKLYSPCESLKIQQLPHRRHKAQERLAMRAAGLTATQNNGFLCVLQLTDAGDIFYQILRHFNPTVSEPHQLDSVAPASNSDPSFQPQVSLDEDSDFEREKHQRMLSQVERVIDDEHNSNSSDEEQVTIRKKEGSSSKPKSSVRSTESNCAHLLRPTIPTIASHNSKLIWKKWLESLLTNAAGEKCSLTLRKIKTSAMMQFNDEQRDKLEEDKFERLRKDQAEILKTKRLLVHGVTYLPPLEVTPVPDEVDTDDWTDDLSQRINAIWNDGWNNWWDEKLGLNRDSKIEALRRKRRQAKRAKARNRLSLASSFTSSVSYQDDLSDWSSATSQYLGSDAESLTNSSAVTAGDVSDLEIQSKNTEQCSDMMKPVKTSLEGPSKTNLSQQDETLACFFTAPFKGFPTTAKSVPFEEK